MALLIAYVSIGALFSNKNFTISNLPSQEASVNSYVVKSYKLNNYFTSSKFPYYIAWFIYQKSKV